MQIHTHKDLKVSLGREKKLKSRCLAKKTTPRLLSWLSYLVAKKIQDSYSSWPGAQIQPETQRKKYASRSEDISSFWVFSRVFIWTFLFYRRGLLFSNRIFLAPSVDLEFQYFLEYDLKPVGLSSLDKLESNPVRVCVYASHLFIRPRICKNPAISFRKT